MQQKLIRTSRIMKLILTCFSIFIILGSFSFASAFPVGKQSFSLLASIIISLGFGAALCLIISDRKKS